MGCCLSLVCFGPLPRGLVLGIKSFWAVMILNISLGPQVTLSPGDSNKSIIFTCRLGYLSGSEVLLCLCVPSAWGALAHHPPGSSAALQGENDQPGSCHPGRKGAVVCLL